MRTQRVAGTRSEPLCSERHRGKILGTDLVEVTRRKDCRVDPADEPAIKPSESRYAIRDYLIAGVVLGALLIGAVTLSGFPGQGPVIGSLVTDETDVPAPGQVWFGTAFDPRTFKITGRTTTVEPGATLVAVAHLSTSIGDDEAAWRLLRNDQPFQSNPLRLSGTGDFLGTTMPAVHTEGRYEYGIVDLRGNVLAAGEFVVANQ